MSGAGDADRLRGEVDALGISLNGLARTMHELGDPRAVATIRTSIQNWSTGRHKVPGTVWVVLRLLRMLAA